MVVCTSLHVDSLFVRLNLRDGDKGPCCTKHTTIYRLRLDLDIPADEAIELQNRNYSLFCIPLNPVFPFCGLYNTMINPLRLLPAIGGHLEKRDTSPWTSVVSTTLFLATEPTSVTLFGYYTTTPAVAGGTIVVSTKSYTTSTTASWATSPLTITSSPDASCSTDYTARGNNVLNIQGSDNPTFQVGYTSACLPTGYATVDYYSPGICPSGYTLALKRDLATVISNTKVAQTEGLCCFKLVYY
jgi:hypothetical protein